MPAGAQVFTMTAPKLYELSRDDPITMKDSRSALEALHRVQRYHEEIYLIEDSEGFTVELPFPNDPTLRKIEAFLKDLEEKLAQGSMVNEPTLPIRIIASIRKELKNLFLHFGFHRSWELSAEIGHSGSDAPRFRIPLPLFSHPNFAISEDWNHGHYGTIPFSHIRVHCHDVGPGDFLYRHYLDRSFKHVLPPFLRLAHLQDVVQQGMFYHTGLEAEFALVEIKNRNLLRYIPKGFDSRRAGRIYHEADVQLERSRPGRPTVVPIILREFRILCSNYDSIGKLEDVTLDAIANGILANLQKEPNRSGATVPHVKTVMRILRERGFWRKRKWNLDAVRQELMNQPT
tara:strand:+ start:562 stop:1596 length:1035 start_codon:yes stop_codon:yes gene_type:complete